MKKIKILSLTILSIVLLINTSCKKEPIASFTISRSSITAGESITFSNTSKDGESYTWDFDDGTTSTTSSPSHTYNDPGTYTVTLTIYTKDGNAGGVSTTTVYVLPTTDLVVYVYYLGTTDPVANCCVGLYLNYDDWFNYANRYKVGYTDAYGAIAFPNVKSQEYWVDAALDYFNNYSLNTRSWVKTALVNPHETLYHFSYIEYNPPTKTTNKILK